MKLKIQNMYTIVFFLIGLFLSCGVNEYDRDSFPNKDLETEANTPTGLSLSVEIVGLDANNPHGDGSGEILLSAAAKNAVNYTYRFSDGSEEVSKEGTLTHTFKDEGTHKYKITVLAYSSTGNTIDISETITVFVAEHKTKLVWADEFEVDGTLSAQNWKLETIAPDNGSWYNGELQHYTNRSDNVYVSDGTLKIVAKKEQYTAQGTTKEYTSARLNSLFSFTYGRVEVRAKLPMGQGTWPAIWMLGSNIGTVGWPVCGEIDIMEHWGHEPGKVSSAVHTTSCHGGCPDVTVGTTVITDYNKEFHVYAVEWTKNSLRFLIDDKFVYAYDPSVKNKDTWPFTADQFIILNVAMGGSWFSVDPNFVSSTMEVDYVRVFQ